MFTGLVKCVGSIGAVRRTAAGLELTITSDFDGLEDGESISVNGACLTVRDVSGAEFVVAAVSTTLERTGIGGWRPGKRVNLERALAVGDRLGGHMVQGHVDCVSRVVSVQTQTDARLLDIEVPQEVARLLVAQGSVAVDGVSLTVNASPSQRVLQVSLIEYTLTHTALADLVVGDEVHIEADVLGKYVRQLLEPYLPGQ